MQNEHDTYMKPTTTDVDIYISKKKIWKNPRTRCVRNNVQLLVYKIKRVPQMKKVINKLEM